MDGKFIQKRKGFNCRHCAVSMAKFCSDTPRKQEIKYLSRRMIRRDKAFKEEAFNDDEDATASFVHQMTEHNLDVSNHQILKYLKMI